ncbi:hypothetical protein HPG69_007900 [Diceros bicornis minor]|uniref:Uncharacterized protein n=1 Tax=Diceros bicornis minor TaxID=77932 RepID=A0A7J7EB32_DICBM|nr:hypothetical protein HPG69_007900 [Diceros bicornis minor]
MLPWLQNLIELVDNVGAKMCCSKREIWKTWHLCNYEEAVGGIKEDAKEHHLRDYCKECRKVDTISDDY